MCFLALYYIQQFTIVGGGGEFKATNSKGIAFPWFIIGPKCCQKSRRFLYCTFVHFENCWALWFLNGTYPY